MIPQIKSQTPSVRHKSQPHISTHFILVRLQPLLLIPKCCSVDSCMAEMLLMNVIYIPETDSVAIIHAPLKGNIITCPERCQIMLASYNRGPLAVSVYTRHIMEVVHGNGGSFTSIPQPDKSFILKGDRYPRNFANLKKSLVLLFGFSPVAFLISNQIQCVISQMKDNKFLIKFKIYYF